MLSKDSVAPTPLEQVRAWLDDARREGVADHLEVTLATVDDQGHPDARVVVIRDIDERGLTFLSDNRARKGRQLAVQPRAAMSVHWPALKRHVRIRGNVVILPSEVSDNAFHARPRRSQIGYCANRQSEPIADRAALEAQFLATERRFEEVELERPDHWHVYALQPDFVEFWQSGAMNLHDRIAYTRTGEGWRIERLQP
ncbi:MAG: pyridoxamine 5'-phosphate oxidase [Georgenia sp.]